MEVGLASVEVEVCSACYLATEDVSRAFEHDRIKARTLNEHLLNEGD